MLRAAEPFSPPPAAPAALPPPLPNGAGEAMVTKPATPNPGSGGFRITADRPFRDQVEDAEREIILHALAFTRDNVTEAARLLDLERGHFYKKMKALGIRRGSDTKDSV